MKGGRERKAEGGRGGGRKEGRAGGREGGREEGGKRREERGRSEEKDTSGMYCKGHYTSGTHVHVPGSSFYHPLALHSVQLPTPSA